MTKPEKFFYILAYFFEFHVNVQKKGTVCFKIADCAFYSRHYFAFLRKMAARMPQRSMPAAYGMAAKNATSAGAL